jgi:hypothetical protein
MAQFLGLLRPNRRAESRFAQVDLAEGEELSSNPLRFVFNGLQTTLFMVDVDWRIRLHILLRNFASPRAHPATSTTAEYAGQDTSVSASIA